MWLIYRNVQAIVLRSACLDNDSHVDSDIAHHTKPTHAEPYHLPLILAPGICQPPQPILPIVRMSEIGVRQSVSSQAALV
ncbi:hypothetical protein GPD55_001048 [Salmonella enterica]|nr:hypothetical protein [Salmonella enterica]